MAQHMRGQVYRKLTCARLPQFDKQLVHRIQGDRRPRALNKEKPVAARSIGLIPNARDVCVSLCGKTTIDRQHPCQCLGVWLLAPWIVRIIGTPQDMHLVPTKIDIGNRDA
ncbi:hypothetical protein D3C87_1614730 [compost metagenome]